MEIQTTASVRIRNPETIKNGSSVGRTVRNQRRRPLVAPWNTVSGKARRRAKNRKDQVAKTGRFIEGKPFVDFLVQFLGLCQMAL